jgi:hypothetical protein
MKNLPRFGKVTAGWSRYFSDGPDARPESASHVDPTGKHRIAVLRSDVIDVGSRLEAGRTYPPRVLARQALTGARRASRGLAVRRPGGPRRIPRPVCLLGAEGGPGGSTGKRRPNSRPSASGSTTAGPPSRRTTRRSRACCPRTAPSRRSASSGWANPGRHDRPWATGRARKGGRNSII